MRAAVPALRITGSILLVAVALTGCSRDKSEPRTTTTTRSGEIVEGGTLRLGLAGPLQPDPALASFGSPSDMVVLDLLHDGLTRLDADGSAVPALATEWTPDASLTSWVFTLDPSTTFASGRGVTSADVIASLERIARGGDTSLAALRLESISGFRAFVEGSAEHLAGLTAPDPTTVQIVLDTPMSVLPVILASPVFGIVDVASLDAAVSSTKNLDGLDLVGGWEVRSTTGPVLTLDRRSGVDGHLDAIELRSYSDSDAAYDAFDQGRVDWALVPVDRYGDALDDHGDAGFTPFHAELFFGMRVTSPILANAELRKAIAAAIDRKAIVRAVYPDLAEPLSTVIPVGVPGHDRGRCADCGFDPARATSILAAAFPDGQIPSVAIDFDESPAQDAMARIVARDLEAVGIPSELRPRPLEEYKAFVVSGAQELFSFGWIGGYVSADAYLAPLFASAANDNLTAYRSDAVDAALAAARASSDPAAAAFQWSEVERQVLTDAVVVPIAQFRMQAVVGERVQGFATAVDGSVDWAAVWLADGA